MVGSFEPTRRSCRAAPPRMKKTFSEKLRNEKCFCAQVPLQARSTLALFTGKGLEIPLFYRNKRQEGCSQTKLMLR